MTLLFRTREIRRRSLVQSFYWYISALTNIRSTKKSYIHTYVPSYNLISWIYINQREDVSEYSHLDATLLQVLYQSCLLCPQPECCGSVWQYLCERNPPRHNGYSRLCHLCAIASFAAVGKTTNIVFSHGISGDCQLHICLLHPEW